MNQSLHLPKDRFAWIILSYAILSELEVNSITYLQLWQGADIPLLSRQSGPVSIRLHGR